MLIPEEVSLIDDVKGSEEMQEQRKSSQNTTFSEKTLALSSRDTENNLILVCEFCRK